MAHEIMNMDQVGMAGTGAWHNLGTVVPADMDPAEAIARFLGFQVEKRPVYHKMADGSFVAIEGKAATVRTDTDYPLGVVGPDYEVLQHSHILEDIKAICGESGAKVHTIGSVRNGRRVWCLLKLQENSLIAGDSVQPYLAVMSSHDGSLRYTVAPSAVRIVCNNTLSAAYSRSQHNGIAIRHSANAVGALAVARAVIGKAQSTFAQFRERLEALAAQKVNNRFAGVLFDRIAGTDKKDKDEITAQAKGVREALMRAYATPKGGITKAVDGTAFGVFNAVTEYVDYKSTVRIRGAGEAEPTANERLAARAESSLWGAGADRRNDALALLEEVLKDKELCAVAASPEGSETPILSSMLG